MTKKSKKKKGKFSRFCSKVEKKFAKFEKASNRIFSVLSWMDEQKPEWADRVLFNEQGQPTEINQVLVEMCSELIQQISQHLKPIAKVSRKEPSPIPTVDELFRKYGRPVVEAPACSFDVPTGEALNEENTEKTESEISAVRVGEEVEV